METLGTRYDHVKLFVGKGRFLPVCLVRALGTGGATRLSLSVLVLVSCFFDQIPEKKLLRGRVHSV